jgi:hypothetical protein
VSSSCHDAVSGNPASYSVASVMSSTDAFLKQWSSTFGCQLCIQLEQSSVPGICRAAYDFVCARTNSETVEKPRCLVGFNLCEASANYIVELARNVPTACVN